MASRKNRILMIVQNLPVPLDRRVWLECRALTAAGIGVSVICPQGPGDRWFSEIGGIRLYKYPPPPAATGLSGYLLEFIYCWLITAVLSVLVAIRDGFTALQACNPPDTYWLLALLWRPFGKRFVYDQHDLNPEVFLSRFGTASTLAARIQLSGLKFLERMTYRVADHVISTNESYRAIAMTRGGRSAEGVTAVRSGPDTSTMRPLEPLSELRAGHSYLAVYLGIMGPQDGIHLALHAFSHVVHRHKRTDCRFALLGFGDCLQELKDLASELGLDDHVVFTGRVGPTEIADYLSTADIGICPDPKSPLNDVSTMNKTMEYMAYCLPVLSFDLVETRVSALEAAIYIPDGDVTAFADAWVALLDDAALRESMGMFARTRVVAELDWAPQAARYTRAWRQVLGLSEVALTSPGANTGAQSAAEPSGRSYISLDHEEELRGFIRDRGRPAG